MRTIACLLLCGSCVSPDATYVVADRTTYEAIAPEYRRYVEMDPALRDEDRARRLLTLETWLERLQAAEGRR